MFLRQSTQQDILIGPVFDSSTGALKSDLAYNASGIACSCYKSMTRAAITLANGAGDEYFRASGGSDGCYLLTLSATDTATIGRFKLTLLATGYNMVPFVATVLDETVYDVLFGTAALLAVGTGTGQINPSSGKVPATVAAGDIANNAITAAAIADAAIDNATFAADVGSTALASNMIAKAAEKAVGVAGVGLSAIPTVAAVTTVTNLTNLPAAAATAAELAKVPKSDSNVSWNATALAAINAEVDTALNTAIPGGPTADSINERIATMDGHLTADYAAAEKAAIDDWTNAGRLDTIIDALTAELAKVPKSDSTVSWNATALAAIALAILNQNLATSDADALNARTVRSALRFLRNKVSAPAGTLTVCKEDDATTAWTAALTTDAAADPITVVDPT